MIALPRLPIVIISLSLAAPSLMGADTAAVRGTAPAGAAARAAAPAAAPADSAAGKVNSVLSAREADLYANAAYINYMKINIEYSSRDRSGREAQKVELFATTDLGRTWRLAGEDPDRTSPFVVNLPRDGAYGFKVVTTDASGVRDRIPQNGTLPGKLVILDTQKPAGRFTSPATRIALPREGVTIGWESNDNHPDSAPVSIEYSVNNGQNWAMVATRQPAVGSIRWTPQVPAQQYLLRLRVRDAAGNESAIDCPGSVVGQTATTALARITGPKDPTGPIADITYRINGNDVAWVELFSTTDDGATWTSVARTDQINEPIRYENLSKASSVGFALRVGNAAGKATAAPRPGSRPELVLDFSRDTEGPKIVIEKMPRILTAGQDATITWSSTDDNPAENTVSIQASMDGGQTWDTLVEGQPASGTYTWPTPANLGHTLNNCVLMVTAVDRGGNKSSVRSSQPFSIMAGKDAVVVAQNTRSTSEALDGEVTNRTKPDESPKESGKLNTNNSENAGDSLLGTKSKNKNKGTKAPKNATATTEPGTEGSSAIASSSGSDPFPAKGNPVAASSKAKDDPWAQAVGGDLKDETPAPANADTANDATTTSKLPPLPMPRKISKDTTQGSATDSVPVAKTPDTTATSAAADTGSKKKASAFNTDEVKKADNGTTANEGASAKDTGAETPKATEAGKPASSTITGTATPVSPKDTEKPVAKLPDTKLPDTKGTAKPATGGADSKVKLAYKEMLVALDEDDAAAAKAKADEAIKLDPNSPYASLCAARILMKDNKPDQALEAAKKAVAASQDNVDAHMTAGEAAFAVGRAAQQRYAKGVEASASQSDLAPLQEKFESSLGESALAFKKASQCSPDDKEPVDRLGDILYFQAKITEDKSQKIKLYHDALDAFTKGYEIGQPNYKEAFHLGVINRRLDQYDTAMRFLRKGIDVCPAGQKPKECYWYMAEVCELKGFLDDARSYWIQSADAYGRETTFGKQALDHAAEIEKKLNNR